MNQFIYVLCSSFFALACADAPERPAPLSDRCGASLCDDPVVGGAVSGVSSTEPAASARPPEDAGSGMPGEVFGEVLAVTSPDLTIASRLLIESVTIYVPGATTELATEHNPADEFRIAIDVPSPWWIRVAPNAPATEFLGVLQQVSQPGALQLFVAERRMLTDVSAGLTRNPVALDPERAQAILHFVDSKGAAVPEVRVEPSSGIVAYDIGEIYTDATDGTATRGAVALFNISVPSAPGSETTVQAFVADLSVQLDFPVVRDTLSTVVFELQDP